MRRFFYCLVKSMHADILDEAAEREQQLIEVALTNGSKPIMTFRGVCHKGDCGEKDTTGLF